SEAVDRRVRKVKVAKSKGSPPSMRTPRDVSPLDRIVDGVRVASQSSTAVPDNMPENFDFCRGHLVTRDRDGSWRTVALSTVVVWAVTRTSDASYWSTSVEWTDPDGNVKRRVLPVNALVDSTAVQDFGKDGLFILPGQEAA